MEEGNRELKAVVVLKKRVTAIPAVTLFLRQEKR
jgi:hypothetical protein